MQFYITKRGHFPVGSLEQPLEPPDCWGCKAEPVVEDDPEWVNDDDHSYILKGGKVHKYDLRGRV